MAGREKKPALVKKQNISAITSKDSDSQLDATVEKTTPARAGAPKPESTAPQQPVVGTSSAKSVVKTKKANPVKKTLKKNLKINFKAKNKKGKKLKLSKSLFKNKKHLDAKNVTIVKNGLKKNGRPTRVRSQANTATVESKVQNEVDPTPPVLEPMTTAPGLNESKSPKKETKKRTKKQLVEDVTEPLLPLIDTKKIKIEPSDKETVDDVLNDVANELQLDLDLLMKKPVKKAKTVKKLVKPAVKQKKPPTPKKAKVEPPKTKKGNEKDKIIEKLSKDIDIDSDAQSVINKLDLNVSKTVKKNVKKRRHSIEKFNAVGDDQESSVEPPFSLFSSIRQSPKNKRTARIRQSIDNIVNKRFNPYATRSDSPARILRNGKHRRLKGSQLLDGIENEYKRRKRLCSEVSTNDISKFSDYLSESDSNFSDMTSVTENGTCDDSIGKEEGVMTKSDLLRKEILESITAPTPEELQNLNIKQISTKFTAILKRSLSTETSQLTDDNINEDVKPKAEELTAARSTFTDTNSNDVKPDIKTDSKLLCTTTSGADSDEVKTENSCNSIKIKKEVVEEQVLEKIASSPSYKVPEKSFILDQMKQIFNDVNEDAERRTTRSSAKRTLKLSTSEEVNVETVPVVKFYGTESTDTEKNETKSSEEKMDLDINADNTESNTNLNEEKDEPAKPEEEICSDLKITESCSLQDTTNENECEEELTENIHTEKEKTPLEEIEKSNEIQENEDLSKDNEIKENEDLNENVNQEDTEAQENEKLLEIDGSEEDKILQENENIHVTHETEDVTEEIANIDVAQEVEDILVAQEIEDAHATPENEVAPITQEVEVTQDIQNSKDVCVAEEIEEESHVKDETEDEYIIQKNEEMSELEKMDVQENVCENENIDNLQEEALLTKLSEAEDMEITEDNFVEDNKKLADDLHEDILNKLRENSALSISVKETSNEEKSKSGSMSSSSSIKEIGVEEMVNLAIKKLDEEKSEEMSMDSYQEESKDKKEEYMETKSEKSDDALSSEKSDDVLFENKQTILKEDITETPENQAIKENILNALGLQSLRAVEEAKLRESEKHKQRNDVYTGTLKTVIKLNRHMDKKKSKERNPLKMTLQKSKGRSSKEGDCDNMKSDGTFGKNEGENACYKVMKEVSLYLFYIL